MVRWGAGRPQHLLMAIISCMANLSDYIIFAIIYNSHLLPYALFTLYLFFSCCFFFLCLSV